MNFLNREEILFRLGAYFVDILEYTLEFLQVISARNSGKMFESAGHGLLLSEYFAGRQTGSGKFHLYTFFFW